VRCESYQSGDRCAREATRCLSWATEDGGKHESSMCATCLAAVRNMLLRSGENPHDMALPSESAAQEKP
jgi:hypothetical protein